MPKGTKINRRQNFGSIVLPMVFCGIGVQACEGVGGGGGGGGARGLQPPQLWNYVIFRAKR